jgi:hypothetical protein
VSKRNRDDVAGMLFGFALGGITLLYIAVGRWPL